jgi:hypothetical protein
MSGMDKEHFALPFGRLLKARGHLLGEELKLELFIDLARQRRALFQGHAQALHRAAALALGKAYAGELLDALHRHLGVGHRCGGEGTLQALPEGLQTAGGTVAAIFEHTFKTALLILQQVGAQGGLADVEAAPDESMTGTFMVHSQGQQLEVKTLWDVVVFKGFADVLKLLGSKLEINHPEQTSVLTPYLKPPFHFESL